MNTFSDGKRHRLDMDEKSELSLSVQTFRLLKSAERYLPDVLERLILGFLELGDWGCLLETTRQFRKLVSNFLLHYSPALVCYYFPQHGHFCAHALKVAQSSRRLSSVTFVNWPSVLQSRLEDWLLFVTANNRRRFCSFTPSRWWPTSNKIVEALDQCENLTSLAIYPEEDAENFIFNNELLRFLAERCESVVIVS